MNKCKSNSKKIFKDNCDEVPTINSSLIQYIHRSRPYDELPKLPDYNEKRDYSTFVFKDELKKKKLQLEITSSNEMTVLKDDSSIKNELL